MEFNEKIHVFFFIRFRGWLTPTLMKKILDFFFKFRVVVVDSALLVKPESSWTGLDPDSDENNPGVIF